MDLIPIDIPAGVSAELPLYATRGTWRDSDKIRFENGLLYSMRGWTSLVGDPVTGKARGGVSWSLLDGQKVAAIGTHKKLFLYRADQIQDITPLRDSGTLGTDPISTESGSSDVTVNSDAHEALVGDCIRLSGATTVGGLDVNGEWEVSEIVDVDNFKFVHTGTANATASGGGASVAYEYDIHAGSADGFIGDGWGAGTWGAGDWGTPREGVDFEDATFLLQPRLWFLHPVGQDLVASYSNGPFYTWSGATPTARAVALTGDPPAYCAFSLYSAHDRTLMAFGVEGDPHLMGWSDQGSLTNWTAGIGSTANQRTVVDGGGFVAAIEHLDEVIFWTGNSIYSHRFVNLATTSHATTRLRSVEPPVSPRAAVAAHGGEIWWLGSKQIYRYTGVVQELPYPVCRRFNDRVDRSQLQKTFAATDIRTNQIMFFYPEQSQTTVSEVNRYLKVNYLDGVTDLGSLDRLTWIDAGTFDYPIGVAADGSIYRHDAKGCTLQTVSLTISVYDYPMSVANVRTSGPWSIEPTTEKLERKMRGRHMQMRLSGTINCADGAHEWFAETSLFDIEDGNSIMNLHTIIPDVRFQDNGDDIAIGRFRFAVRADGREA